MLGFYDYSNRKPQPRTFKHVEGADCLCPACCAKNQREHPEEYAVFQAVPAPGATVTDLTAVEMRTFAFNPYVGKRAQLRRKNAAGKFEHVTAAMILSL